MLGAVGEGVGGGEGEGVEPGEEGGCLNVEERERGIQTVPQVVSHRLKTERERRDKVIHTLYMYVHVHLQRVGNPRIFVTMPIHVVRAQ